MRIDNAFVFVREVFIKGGFELGKQIYVASFLRVKTGVECFGDANCVGYRNITLKHTVKLILQFLRNERFFGKEVCRLSKRVYAGISSAGANKINGARTIKESASVFLLDGRSVFLFAPG